ncbi:hypothetical protein LSAT2_009465 [Lamellibrachia satsuma]|nr:hypothetical protein LSAT2_009465 [Lamellibrachia satsuma]
MAKNKLRNTARIFQPKLLLLLVAVCIISAFVFTSTRKSFPHPAYFLGYAAATRSQRLHTNTQKYATQESDGTTLSTINTDGRVLLTINTDGRVLSTLNTDGRVLSTINPDRRALSTTTCSDSSRLCGDSAVRNCVIAHDYFPEEQHWNNTKASFPGSRFVPRFCRFKHDVIPPQLLQRCLRQKQMKRIVVIGDSQGNHYFSALKQILEPIANCKQQRKDLWQRYFPRRLSRAAKLQNPKPLKRVVPRKIPHVAQSSRFLPRFCRFKHDVIPPQLLQRCLRQKQMKHIVVIGDSQGNHYFSALKQMLEPIANCKQLRKDLWQRYLPRRLRRAAKLQNPKPRKRHNLLFECVFKNSSEEIGRNNDVAASLPKSVLIEFISVISFTDRELPSTPSDCSNAPVHGAGRCNETQPRMLFPTLFGDYFARDKKYPNVILLFSNSHDKGHNKPLNTILADIASLRDVVNQYVPRTTAFYWFSHHSENDSRKEKRWRHIIYEGKYTANEMIITTNRAMYDLLREDIQSDRIRTFFDLYAMTLALRNWSVDGIHFKYDWYRYLMSYWFQTTCSKFM